MKTYSIIKNVVSRGRSLILFISIATTMSLFTTSCEDFLDVSSNMVIDADENHLSSARDSIYSVIGILNKLQAIADRTVLLGEARADLVDITQDTNKDLRDLALFNIDDDNKYNSPREYYAIINNCNYFIHNVDTAMANNRNENVYLNEYAVVKAIRAWTYLQLATIYGKVPFVTEPILSKEDGEKTYPMYDIQQVCDYFLNEDGLQNLADNEKITYPYYGDIKSTPSRLFFVQLNLILGDLYLWRGSLTDSKADFLNSAKRYYTYIRYRNGRTTSSAYPTYGNRAYWISTSSWNKRYVSGAQWADNLLHDESNSSVSEVITVIPMDSVQSEGYYSDLRSIFSAYSNEEQKVELVPSESIKELSAAQTYCYYDTNAKKYFYAPKGIGDYCDGDLRLKSVYDVDENAIDFKGDRFTAHAITKFNNKNGNVHIYRRGQVYLRFAEAMNRAGYPRYAYQILASGVNSSVIRDCISPFLTETELQTVLEFDFPSTYYIVSTWRSEDPAFVIGDRLNNANHIGIHSRGSGESAFNDYYKMPYGEAICDTIPILDENGDTVAYYFNIHKDSETTGLVERQIEAVEEMILDEMALETAFEGYRFYDIMRVAYRRHDPSYLAKKVYGRNGSNGSVAIGVDLNNQNNWFLRWNNQIGIY